jgi:lysyl-tRNA synthetase class 2
MKQLLVEGCERIFQIASVWRGDEQTPLHSPEFSMLEWYRAWEGREAILDDTEQIVDRLLWHRSALMGGESTRIADCSPPFERLTVSELSEKTCGFDICDYQQLKPLAEICRRKALLPEDNIDRAVASGNWDELFFELQISHFDPFLEQLGAVFVTNWPARLAVLAKRREDNPQIARRFELYIGGIEIANGFVELTDPDEQAERFRDDLRKRKQLGRPQLPFPDQLIDALEWGLPPSTGIALGLDRLFMIALGAEHINQVLPFS